MTATAPARLGRSDLEGITRLCRRAVVSPPSVDELEGSLFAEQQPAVVMGDPSTGVVATVDDVLTVLGGTAIGPQAAAHVKGALNKLHTWRLAQLGPPGGEEAVTADLGVPVRVGPAVALWSGPWVGELMTLLGHLTEHRRPR